MKLYRIMEYEFATEEAKDKTINESLNDGITQFGSTKITSYFLKDMSGGGLAVANLINIIQQEQPPQEEPT